MSDLSSLSLDELFAQVKHSREGQKKQKELSKPAKAAKPAAEETPAQRLYNDPANWYRTRGVALIEEGTETLLGNFSEYLHYTVPGARKLVREELPVSVAAVEYVKGWVPTEARSEVAVAHKSFTTRVFLQLTLLDFVGEQAQVTAYHYCGAISRVELRTPVSFCLPGEELLTLPTGTNVLEVLSPASLRALELEIDK